ncbi:MAG TPA: hypothetical protein PKL77_04695 [Candidatus Omnitrophota bacterium]|nr:hypothetical protein [Candidatus Omnitrophota bacterium]HPT07694.1 hypothetical protein [Candidatus Omnitrophota bacterium]
MKKGIKVLKFAVLVVGGFLFSVSLFYLLADLKYGSFGGFFFLPAMYGFSISILCIIGGLVKLTRITAVTFLKKAALGLVLISIGLIGGYLTYYATYCVPKIVAKETKKKFFSGSLPDSSWVTLETPLYFIKGREQFCSINANGTNRKVIFESKFLYDFILSPSGDYALIETHSDIKLPSMEFQKPTEPSKLYFVCLDTRKYKLIENFSVSLNGPNPWFSRGEKFFLKNGNTVDTYYVTNGEREAAALEDMGVNSGHNVWDQVDSRYRYKVPPGYKTGFLRISDHGQEIKMNYRDNYLYYNDGHGIAQKLFFIAREGEWLNFPDVVIAPGGRYIVLNNPDHREKGIYIFDAFTGKLGRLLRDSDIMMFGFYERRDNESVKMEMFSKNTLIARNTLKK